MAELSTRATDLTDLKDALLQTNETFRELVTEHHRLDERIRQLSSSPLLTSQEQYEETSLKKLKLALKDRIEAMLRGHPDSTRH
jgi:uncharacterized protein YdcH (DUF465 family)